MKVEIIFHKVRKFTLKIIFKKCNIVDKVIRTRLTLVVVFIKNAADSSALRKAPGVQINRSYPFAPIGRPVVNCNL